MSTLQSQISLVHLESELAVPSITQRKSVESAFSVNAVTVTTTPEVVPLGDVVIPRNIMLKIVSGNDLLVSLDGGTVYPLSISGDGDSMLLELESRETTTITCGADTAGSLSGDYFDLQDKDGTVRLWFDIPALPAVAASVVINPTGADNSILYTAVVPGTAGNSIAITYVISGGGSAVTGIVVTGSNLEITAGSATTADTVIAAVIADTPASALVSVAASGTTTGVIDTIGSIPLIGGVATIPASVAPTAPEQGRLSPVVIARGDIDTAVATAVDAVLDADSMFTSSRASAVLTVVNRSSGVFPLATNGTTGWTVTRSRSTPISVWVKSAGTSQVVIGVAPH